jgi:hypothetical protein
MESEFNRKPRQNKMLGIVSSFKFSDFAAQAHGDHIMALENLTSGISNSTQIIPQEYRSDSHTKRFLETGLYGGARGIERLSDGFCSDISLHPAELVRNSLRTASLVLNCEFKRSHS